jgi:hypothetical protein
MPSYIYSNNYPITIGSYFYTDVCLTTSASTGAYSDGTNCFTVTSGGYVSAVDSCSGPSYDIYLADRYDCSNCTFVNSGYLIAVTSGTTINYSEYYTPEVGTGEQGVYYYQPYSSSSGSGLICSDVSVSTCGLACTIP